MSQSFSIALIKAYHAQMDLLRPRAAALGLSIGQPKLLLCLSRCNGCMQKELAESCGVEPATISRMLSKMETQGLISREVPPDNKRACAVRLTGRGRALSRQVMELRGQSEEQGLRGFSPEERAAFLDYLVRFRANLAGEKEGSR